MPIIHHCTTRRMATPTALRSFTPFVCQSCRQHIKPKNFRSFVTSSKRRAEADPLGSFLDRAGPQSSNNPRNGNRSAKPSSSYMLDAFDRDPSEIWANQAGENMDFDDEQPPHRLHVYATKHNTHITLVQPQKSAAKPPARAYQARARAVQSRRNKSTPFYQSAQATSVSAKPGEGRMMRRSSSPLSRSSRCRRGVCCGI